MTELEVKMSEMAEAKIDQAASDYEGKISHPRHWDCCYYSGDTEKHFANGAKWAINLPEVAELYKVADQCLRQWRTYFEESNCEDLETTLEEDPLNVEAIILKESIESIQNWKKFKENSNG